MRPRRHQLQEHKTENFMGLHSVPGNHIRMTGPFHFELVAKDGEFTVYVTDQAGNNIGMDGGLAKTTIETGSTIEGRPSRIQVELDFVTIRTTLRGIARLVLVQLNHFHSTKMR